MIKKLLLVSFLFIAAVGFSQEKSMSKLVASPNPFSDKTTITFTAKNKKSVFLSVRNVLGKTVFRQKIQTTVGKNTYVFRRKNLKSGMYIYIIQNEKEVISKRFVIR